MFDRIHEMRARIITSPAFTGERILGAILFEMTMDRQIDGSGRRGVPVAGEGRRAVPQGRPGPGGRGRRRPGHEADPRPRRTPRPGEGATACSAPRCARSSRCGNAGRSGRRRAPAVRGGPPDHRGRPGADHRARDRHPQPGEGAGRGAAQGRAPRRDRRAARPTSSSCSSSRCPSRTTSTPSSWRTRTSCAWSRSRAATPGSEANALLARNHGVVASFSRALTEGLSAQQSRRRVRRRPRRLDREHLPGVDHLTAVSRRARCRPCARRRSSRGPGARA